MFIYLKGISKSEIENVIDFLYNEETFVAQHKLNSFLVSAQELKVKGLQTMDDESNCIESNPNIAAEQSLISTGETESYQSQIQNAVLHNDEIILSTDDEELDNVYKNFVLDEKLEGVIERSLGVWKCKVCDKTSNSKRDLKYHAETHARFKTLMHYMYENFFNKTWCKNSRE